MDALYLEILREFGIQDLENLDGVLIERDAFLNDEIYKRVKTKVVNLKTYFSSSMLTSLQQNASLLKLHQDLLVFVPSYYSHQSE